jgi:hypothetical protein
VNASPTITDPDHYRRLVRAALDTAIRDWRNRPPGQRRGDPADHLTEAVLAVHDRHLQQLRQRLELADHICAELAGHPQETL